MSTDSVAAQAETSSECLWEPDQPDWDMARRVWEKHQNCPPGCLAQLVAGAVLSSENQED